MLVISRKAHEFLQIGDDIIVKVIKTSTGSVKIGIEAPGDVRVLRGELSEEPMELPVATNRSGRLTPNAEVLQAAEAL
jgi:carbon storage regulator